MRSLTVLFLALLTSLAVAQSTLQPKLGPTPTPAPPPALAHPTTATALQSAVDRLTQSNRDLLDLLKQQQAVLEDIQYDRRLQSRQIQSLEERLEDALQQNTQLQDKVTALENAAATGTPTNVATAQAPAATNTDTPPPPPPPPPTPDADTPPPPPASYLPPPEPEGEPGTKSWHRLFTLSGTDSKTTDLFTVTGPQWRVVWHNQDKDGKDYENTSALFINAFPKDDTIPQKVCAKLGSGGDATELNGPGNYYLKVEASGGSWELAVEDFR